MKRTLIPILLALALPAAADTTAGSESTSQAQSSSGIIYNQSNGYRGTPSMGAPSMMGECGGSSGAASGPGFGLSLGGGDGSPACNLRADAAMMAALGGNQLAILHVCMSRTKRTNQPTKPAATLIAAGLCGRPAAAGAPPARPFGSICELTPGGTLRVSISPGYTQAQAVRACRQSLR